MTGPMASVLEKRVADAAARYARSLIEASPDPFVATSPDGKITDVNEATIKLTGVARDQLIGTDFSTYFTEPEKAREGYRQVLAVGSVTDCPLTVQHRHGHLVDVLYSASVYRDTDEEVLGVFAAVRDITLRKRDVAELARCREQLEETAAGRTTDLAAANAQLEAANNELETFSYSISHDLRAPLRAIDGFSRFLLEDYTDKLDAEGRRMLGVLRKSAATMRDMIDGILAFSRAGRAGMAPVQVDMTAAVASVIKDLAPVIADRKVAFELGTLAPVQGDRVLLQTVWLNLIENALKYTRSRSETRIEIGASPGRDEIEFFVRDNGVGFDMQYRDKLFGVFQRLHGAEFPGTGIGLAIVKRIIARHGGRVWAESTVDQGAAFHFALPVLGSDHA